MSTAATRMDENTWKLYVAFELGEKEWKLAMSPSFAVRSTLPGLRSRATARLLEVLVRARGHWPGSGVDSDDEIARWMGPERSARRGRTTHRVLHLRGGHG